MKTINKRIVFEHLPQAENYKNLTPMTHNIKLARIKGLYENGAFTQRFLLIQTIYRLLLSRFILKKTGLKRIDAGMKEHEVHFVKKKEGEKDFYQRYDLMELDYIYLRNPLHIERLEEDQLVLLESWTQEMSQEDVKRVKQLIEDTYKEVLPFSEEYHNREIPLFPSLYGEGNVPENSIVFVIAAMPECDERGNIKDLQAEEKRQSVLLSLKGQLEPMLSIILKVPVKIVVDKCV